MASQCAINSGEVEITKVVTTAMKESVEQVSMLRPDGVRAGELPGSTLTGKSDVEEMSERHIQIDGKSYRLIPTGSF